MEVSVIVPVCNELDNLVPLHYALTEILSGLGRTYEILLVDDGSTDGSLALMRRLAEQDSAVRVIELARNFGQTAALDAGLQAATGAAIVTLDADLQNDPADIPGLLARLDEGYDLVYGWRKHRQDRLVTRLLPSRMANWLIQRVTGFPAHDIGCTFKALRRETARGLKLYGDFHRFIPILAHAQGAHCAELVVRHHPRRFGQTKYGLSRTLRVAVDLLLVQFLTRYAACPMRLFGRVAITAGAISAGSTTLALALKLLAGVPLWGNVLWVVAAVAALGAFQALGLGLVAEVVMRTYFESRGRRPYEIRDSRDSECQSNEELPADARHSESPDWLEAERQAA